MAARCIMATSLLVARGADAAAWAAGGVATAASAWTKGDFATLDFDLSSTSVTYSMTYPSSITSEDIVYASNVLDSVGPAVTSSGADSLGAYDALELPMVGGAVGVRYYASEDAFVWTRAPTNASLQSTWPSFDEAKFPNASRCLYWESHFFFPGGEPGCYGPQDGPSVVFEPPSNATAPVVSSAALVIAPLSHFTTTFGVHCAAPVGHLNNGVVHVTVLLHRGNAAGVRGD